MDNDRSLDNTPPNSLDYLLTPQAEQDDPTPNALPFVSEYPELRNVSPQPHPARYVWGCGRGGVIRWDITPSQTTYKIWRREHGLFDQEPTSILAQPDRVVVGHVSGGLSLFDMETKTWKSIETRFPVRGLISDGPSPTLTLALCDNGLLNIDRGTLLPTPDVPLVGAIRAGQPWIGTTTGLYAYTGEGWTRWLDERMITHAIADNGIIWAAWADGVARIDPETPERPVSHYDIEHRAVHGIARGGGRTYVLVSGMLHIIHDSGELQAPTKMPRRVVLLAANDHQLVFGTRRQLRWQSLNTTSSSRDLLPDWQSQPTQPENVWTTINTASALWAQTTSGQLWRQHRTSPLWEDIWKPMPPLCGVVEVNGTTLLCFEGREGLGVVEGDQIVFNADIKYPQRLTLEDRRAHVVAHDGTYQSADGLEWTKA